jgi:hypothetical protein
MAEPIIQTLKEPENLELNRQYICIGIRQRSTYTVIANVTFKLPKADRTPIKTLYMAFELRIYTINRSGIIIIIIFVTLSLSFCNHIIISSLYLSTYHYTIATTIIILSISSRNHYLYQIIISLKLLS